MRQPIQIALTYPERRPLNSQPLDLVSLGKLEFFAPDTQKFPCLALATESLRRAKCYPTALNAASEVAVKAFLSERILFTDIPVVISSVLDADFSAECSYPSLCRADRQAREMASKIIEKQH
jgi:1-deoxy-D-xylulose-5-phosphate reductoisomerase